MVKVAYTVGRFQPPTIGHKALIQAVKDAAGDGGQAYVFVSSETSPKTKNPLTSKQKMPILSHMFPSGVTFIDTQDCKDRGEKCGGALNAFYWLHDGKKIPKEDITLVVGDDHKDDFGPEADMWKRKEEKDVYSPAAFKFLKSAKRDPDLEVKDAANMSGTKARQYVKDSRKDDFYIAVGYDGAANKAAADAVFDVIANSGKKKGKSGGTRRKLPETAFGADDEFTYSKRKTLRRKVGSARRERRTRRGGRKIGEGTRNAVFSVPFPCEPPLKDRPVVMLISIDALRQVRAGAPPDEISAAEKARPTRPIPEVLSKLRTIDPNADTFYYPLACSVRVPKPGEPIDEDLKDLTSAQLEQLLPYVQIIPYGSGGVLASRKNKKTYRPAITEAVKTLNDSGIAHGDISGGNIVFDAMDKPHLIDFGQSSVRVGETNCVKVQTGFECDILNWQVAIRSDAADIKRAFKP